MKVHFAGNGFKEEVLTTVGVNYRLNSFYDIEVTKKTQTEDLRGYKHLIIDSGLFTYMFGAESKMDFTYEFCTKWFDKYVKFIKEIDYKNAHFVELDIQKKLGSEVAWDFRKELEARVGKNLIINAYHLEDNDPTRLIDHSDYLAVPMVEFRMNLSEKERIHLTSYIVKRAMAKGKKIHLFGCTERKYLKIFSNCYSCDSTSWLRGVRFGNLKFENKLLRIETLPKSIPKKFTCHKSKRSTQIFWSAFLSLQYYQKYAGDQT